MNSFEQLYLKIQKLRLALGLSTAEFAKLSGLEEELVIQVEKGIQEMSASYFVKVIQTFGISADRLILADLKYTDFKTFLYDTKIYSPLDAKYDNIKSKDPSAAC